MTMVVIYIANEVSTGTISIIQRYTRILQIFFKHVGVGKTPTYECLLFLFLVNDLKQSLYKMHMPWMINKKSFACYICNYFMDQLK